MRAGKNAFPTMNCADIPARNLALYGAGGSFLADHPDLPERLGVYRVPRQAPGRAMKLSR